MTAPTAELLALHDTDPTAFVLAVAAEVEAEASRVSLGTSSRFDVEDPEKGAWLVDFLLVVARGWRGAVDRHQPVCFNSDEAPYVYAGCSRCRGGAKAPCPDLTETADEALAYLGGPR